MAALREANGGERPTPEQIEALRAQQGDNANAPANNADTSKNEASATSNNPRRGMGMFGQLAQQSATSVEVLRPNPTIQSAQLTVYGIIEAQRSTTINATSSATVYAINTSEGALVSAGDELYSLSSSTTLEQLNQRQASLAELDARIRNENLKHENDIAALEIEKELVRIAKNAVDRFTSLNAQQLSSNNDYESALRTYQSQLLSLQNRELTLAQYEDSARQLQAQRDQLQSQIRQTQELVDDLAATAPFDGLIAKSNVTLGQTVNTGEVLIEMYDPESLVLYVRVPVRYRLDLSTLSSVSALDTNGRRWQVNAIRPINESGAQRLTLVPEQNTEIQELPGSHLELTLTYPVVTPTIDVPATAVYDQQRVYVFDRDTAAIRAVDIEIEGRSEEGYLISGEFNGPIIKTRLKNPVTGMKVSIVRPGEGSRS
jgi:multidrug efflux pump subunit AcrA (membrane-fusion protein)